MPADSGAWDSSKEEIDSNLAQETQQYLGLGNGDGDRGDMFTGSWKKGKTCSTTSEICWTLGNQ